MSLIFVLFNRVLILYFVLIRYFLYIYCNNNNNNKNHVCVCAADVSNRREAAIEFIVWQTIKCHINTNTI